MSPTKSKKASGGIKSKTCRPSNDRKTKRVTGLWKSIILNKDLSKSTRRKTLNSWPYAKLLEASLGFSRFAFISLLSALLFNFRRLLREG